MGFPKRYIYNTAFKIYLPTISQRNIAKVSEVKIRRREGEGKGGRREGGRGKMRKVEGQGKEWR